MILIETGSSNSTLSKSNDPWKARIPISMSEDGNESSDIPVSANANWPMRVSDDGRQNVTKWRFMQTRNVFSSIISTEHGMAILEMCDPLNACEQISFNREFDPNESETREKQLQNADRPIDSIESGIVIALTSVSLNEKSAKRRNLGIFNVTLEKLLFGKSDDVIVSFSLSKII
jgi:hypothetical protein